MLSISPASLDDIPVLCELLHELFGQEAEFQPDRQAQARGLQLIISNPAVGHILVARRQTRIVAMVNLLYTVSTALGERVVLLEDMLVTQAERGNGVGSRLLTAAIDFARQQGCKRITLLTDSDNEAAQAFYAKHGFSRSGMLPMRLLLSE
jgi:GNAT superfamily N-acetyltransferase